MRDVSRLERVDGTLALVISMAALGLYATTLQDWYYGDGPQLVNRFVQSIEAGRLEIWMHVLYMPAAYLLECALPGYQPLLALEMLSALSMAVVLGGSFLVARGFGVSRKGAWIAAALWLVTPASWFFGTSIEVHGTHAAAVAVGACITLFGPWRVPVLAVALSCAVFPLVYLTHRTGLLLGPAWVLLVQFAKMRATGAGFGWRGLVFGVGVAHLGSLVLAMLVGQMLYGGDASLGVTTTLAFVEKLYRGYSWRVVEYGVVYPFAFLIPVLILGCLGWGSLQRWLLVAAVLPITSMFLFVFGDPTEGGYFLGVAPFLLAITGHGLDRMKGPLLGWVVLTLLVGQATMGVRRVRFSGYEHLGPERIERAERTHELFPDGGVVVALDFDSQTISGMYEGLREMNLVRILEASRATRTPEQFAIHLREMAKTFGKNLAFDLGYGKHREVVPDTVAYADATFAALRRNGPTRKITIRGREYLRLDG
jgi:hypothetical protein